MTVGASEISPHRPVRDARHDGRAPIERIYRDARGFWFEEGTQEIQQLVVARHVLDGAAG